MISDITNPLPVPSMCDVCCSSSVNFIEAETNFRSIYKCRDCGASVSCHTNTDIPMGRMANRATRQLRAEAHKYFDRFYLEKLMMREDSYQWLANVLGIEFEACHISLLTDDQLLKTISESKRHYDENLGVMLRRKSKKSAKYHKRTSRQINRQIRRKTQS